MGKHERLTDAAIEMADNLIAGIFTRAKNTQARRYAATSRDVSLLMRLFRGAFAATGGTLPTGAGTPADTAAPGGGPDWAQRLRREQRFREGLIVTAHTLRDGDRPAAGEPPTAQGRRLTFKRPTTRCGDTPAPMFW